MVLMKYIQRLPGLQGFTSLTILHLHALEVKEIEESQGDQHVHSQAVGVEKEFEQEFDEFDPTMIKGGPVIGPEKHQGNLVG